MTTSSRENVARARSPESSEREWLCPSTRAFLEEARRTPGYSTFDLLHGLAYARWPYFYIRVGTGEHWLARPLGALASLWSWLMRLRSPLGSRGSTADGYHGKVVPLGAAKSLVTVGEDIQVSDLERVIPYPRARALILRNPGHIVAVECPCRAARRDPCLPLDVCLIVGEPFASYIIEHHPARARWLSATEAVGILEEEHARGHVHHAFFKDAMLGRFYAICNCCSCCCGAMQAHRNGTPMLASSGYVSRVDESLCVGCGDCREACPFDALAFDEGAPLINESACMGCGVCASACETGALTLAREPARGEPLEVLELLPASQSL